MTLQASPEVQNRELQTNPPSQHDPLDSEDFDRDRGGQKEKSARFLGRIGKLIKGYKHLDQNGPETEDPATATGRQDERDLKAEQPGQAGENGSQLAQTHVLENQEPPIMSFTYSAGSKPLPRYTIRRGVGIGGFGEVYFAVSDAGKEVAIKRIQRNLEIELRGVSHCLNLKHINLVSLFDVCRDDNDQSWVVMEYVAGPNLREVLDDTPNGLSAEEVKRWFSAIAAGVAHLHNAGLVHRDLKPANVFDDLGTVKVGDYGLSKYISSTQRGGHTESVGTFHYMAPEIGRGQYGRQIDIYAMGVMLFEMVTGKVPFDGESSHEIIVKHLTAAPDLSSIPQPYRDTISRCLEKDPARRFETVEDLMESLDLDRGEEAAYHQVASDSPVAPSREHNEPKMARLVSESSPAYPSSSPTVFPLSGEPPHGRPVHAMGAHQQAAYPKTGQPRQGEPVANAIGDAFSDLNRWWQSLDQTPGSKVFLIIAACAALAINTHWLLPLLSLAAMVYVPYYVIRHMVLSARTQPSYPEAHRNAYQPVSVAPPPPLTKAQWKSQLRSQLRTKSSIDRAAELSVSWVTALVTISVLGLITGIVGLRTEPVSAATIAPYVGVAMIVLLCSFSLLSLGKLWEQDEGESFTRRLVLGGVGAMVGAVAFAIMDFLMLPLDQSLTRDIDAFLLPQALYGASGVPMVTAMMAHFAALFFILRWWKPVDPLRRRRLSVWLVAVAVVGEWVVHQLLPIPQPGGMLIAGGVAIVIQMSAPWVNPSLKEKQPQGIPVGTSSPENSTDPVGPNHPNYVNTGGVA